MYKGARAIQEQPTFCLPFQSAFPNQHNQLLTIIADAGHTADLAGPHDSKPGPVEQYVRRAFVCPVRAITTAGRERRSAPCNGYATSSMVLSTYSVNI